MMMSRLQSHLNLPFSIMVYYFVINTYTTLTSVVNWKGGGGSAAYIYNRNTIQFFIGTEAHYIGM